MMKLPLNEQGFLTHWLIAGPKLTDFRAEKTFDDQLAYEKYMRGLVHDNRLSAPPEDIALGSVSDLGAPWRYVGGENWFVDESVFYSLPVKVELYACTEIVAPCVMRVDVNLWTYAAMDLWLGDRPVCTVPNPVYKPITRATLTLELKAGVNRLFARMQNLGVRDTRNIFGVQFLGDVSSLRVSLPASTSLEALVRLDEWLKGVSYKGDTLSFPPDVPADVLVQPMGVCATEGLRVPENVKRVSVQGTVSGHTLIRELEILAHVRPQWADAGKSVGERRNDMMRRIAQAPIDGQKYSVFNVLARHALGEPGEDDGQLILDSLRFIDAREDCSDFIAVGVIRALKLCVLDASVQEAIRKTFQNYRFWMDENGADGMCFWSENHALLFHGTQLVVGGLYPDAHFLRSGRTGREQEAIGLRRVEEWLSDIEADGFEEFISSGYMCVTLGALLNLVDFGPESVSARAAHVTDMLLRQLCLHTFHGSVFGPQGRVYRDVIHPFEQGTQAIIHYIDPDAPWADDRWLACFAGSRYILPEGLKALMQDDVSKRYPTGNGEIVLHKRAQCVMTSLASPKDGDGRPAWRNISFDPNAKKDSYRYVKSLNERFHGTTRFEPGVFGYQQHFWYAALDNECVVFTNHPGGTVDKSTMRPGYWYGNGIFPAVKQQDNLVGAIYAIPEDYPIHFTHLYFPAVKFDAYEEKNGWIFARKGTAWLGVWCSVPLVWHDDMLCGSELRAQSDLSAFVCRCSDARQDASFEAFIEKCESLDVYFDEGCRLLTCGDDFALHYAACVNHTQYI